MSSTAKNLEAIQRAIVQHDGNCGAPLVEIRLNPFEVDRLGWEEFQGIPIKGDDGIPTGRFSLVCEGEHGKDAPADAVAEEREVTAAGLRRLDREGVAA